MVASIRDISWLILLFGFSACEHETNQRPGNTSYCEPSPAAIHAAIEHLISADNAHDVVQVMSTYIRRWTTASSPY